MINNKTMITQITKAMTICKGKINSIGYCEKCFQKALTSAGYCSQIVESPNEERQEIERLIELKQLSDERMQKYVIDTEAKIKGLESKLQELEKDQEKLIDEIIIIYSKWANNGDVDNAEQKAFDEIKSKFFITRRE